jgi:hypothetical protein
LKFNSPNLCFADPVPHTLTWEGESSMDHDNSERPLLKWKDSSGKGKDIADD